MEISRFKILTAETPAGLEAAVNAGMADGWQPVGAPTCSPGATDARWAQAMTRVIAEAAPDLRTTLAETRDALEQAIADLLAEFMGVTGLRVERVTLSHAELPAGPKSVSVVVDARLP